MIIKDARVDLTFTTKELEVLNTLSNKAKMKRTIFIIELAKEIIKEEENKEKLKGKDNE